MRPYGGAGGQTPSVTALAGDAPRQLPRKDEILRSAQDDRGGGDGLPHRCAHRFAMTGDGGPHPALRATFPVRGEGFRRAVRAVVGKGAKTGEGGGLTGSGGGGKLKAKIGASGSGGRDGRTQGRRELLRVREG